LRDWIFNPSGQIPTRHLTPDSFQHDVLVASPRQVRGCRQHPCCFRPPYRLAGDTDRILTGPARITYQRPQTWLESEFSRI